MIMGVIFKAGKEIDRGIKISGSHYVEGYPDQEIEICSQCDAYNVKAKREYEHKHLTHFEEYQDNGNGWEKVYDSREGIDRTKEYDLPRWVWDAHASIPNVRHTMKGKDIEAENRGYIR